MGRTVASCVSVMGESRGTSYPEAKPQGSIVVLPRASRAMAGRTLHEAKPASLASGRSEHSHAINTTVRYYVQAEMRDDAKLSDFAVKRMQTIRLQRLLG